MSRQILALAELQYRKLSSIMKDSQAHPHKHGQHFSLFYLTAMSLSLHADRIYLTGKS